MRAALTDRYIQSIKSSDYSTHWDLYLPAFGIRCGKRSRTFVCMVSQNRKRITLGRYPAMSLKDARDKARLILSRADTCSPCFADALADTNYSPVFADALEDFVRQHLLPNTKPRSAHQIERWLRRHFAHLNSTPIVDITPRAITAALAKLAKTPTEANNTYTSIKNFFNWAVARQLIPVSPTRGIKMPFKRIARDRLLSDAETRAIWFSSNHQDFNQLIRSLILSGQRLNQIQSFDPAWIQGDVIVFPAAVMKNNLEHAIPLTQALKDNLSLRPVAFKRPLEAARASLKFRHWTLHDFRRYFSSTMARIGVPIDVTEALLSHRSGARSHVQRIYDRFDRLEPMRQALQRYEKYVFTTVLAEQS